MLISAFVEEASRLANLLEPSLRQTSKTGMISEMVEDADPVG
jgi:hypothetical protein